MLPGATAALEALKAAADPEKAAVFLRYHKVPRTYFGIAYPALDRIAVATVRDHSPEEALVLARELWTTDIFEARVLAARICQRPVLKGNLAAVWAAIEDWKKDFDSWAIADAVAKAGARCLQADPSRLRDVERWTKSRNMWVRRAALVFTLDWAKPGHDPGRMLGWAESYAADRDWFIQKAIGWWLRELSKHDPARVRAFLQRNGDTLAPVACSEASKYLARDDRAY